MAIRQRGGTWQVDIKRKGIRYRKGGFETEATALAHEAATLRQIERGVPLVDTKTQVDSAGWTMLRLQEAVYARYWAQSKNGPEAERLSLKAVEFFGEALHPKEINAALVDDYVASMRTAGNSLGTINRKLSALSKMLNYAYSRGIITSKPHIERYKESEGRVRYYTRAEEDLLRAGMYKEANGVKRPDRTVQDFFTFLLDTGARLSEGLNVQIQDITPDRVTFNNTKGGRNRSVPLTARLRAIVVRRLEGLEGQSKDTQFWMGLSKRRVYKRWKVARKHAGLDKDEQAVIHACRHTFASRLVQGGISILVVKELLGHATLTMTLRYAHLAPHNVEAAVKVLETAA